MCYTYKSFRCLDLQIRRFFMLTSDKTNCFTPCACAWGNDINWGALNHASVTTIIVCVTVCVCVCMSCMVNVHVYECACMCV